MKNEKTQKLVKFALYTAVFSWALLAYAKIGEFLMQGILFARILAGRPYVSDFANFYNAATLAAACLQKSVNVYDISVQNESLKALIAPVVPEQPFYMQYPPCLFVFVFPLSLFTIQWAWFLWVLVGVIAGGIGLYLLCRKLLNQSRNTALLSVALAYSSYPAWLSVELGQTSLYLFVGTAFMLYFLQEKKAFKAGLTSALLMVKLQYTPVLLLFGLICGRLPFFAGSFCAFVVLTILSAMLLGLHNLTSFPQAILSNETGQAVSGVSSFLMQNLRGELVLLMQSDGKTVLYIVIGFFVLALAATAYLAQEAYKNNSLKVFNPAAALTIIIALISSPHTHMQDYILFSIAAFFLLQFLEEQKGNSAAATLSRSIIYASLPLSWLLFILQDFMAMLKIQSYFILSLMLLVAILSMKPFQKREP
ncbi:MAG: DUF2029 domain-containing protein [Candidatus Obscuribacterales bacterium]|nr:DUF2029 domain-containing protein [Candidatus Obscuribacterales bacterium]